MRSLIYATFLLFCTTAFAQNIKDPNKELFYAIFDNDLQRLEAAFVKGADVNAAYHYERYSTECKNWLPAHCAAAVGNIKIIKLLKLKGAKFSELVKTGDCNQEAGVLHFASGYGSNELISYFLSEGLDINTHTENGKSPLFDAIHNNKLETAELLLKKGADPNLLAHDCQSGTFISPLVLSIVEHKNDFFDLLIENTAKIDNKDFYQSPLYHAVNSGNLRAAAVLIQKGADKNIRNTTGETLIGLVKNMNNPHFSYLMEQGKLSEKDAEIIKMAEDESLKKFKLEFKKAPIFELSDIEGDNFKITSFGKKLLLINVWASWCTPCVKEMPSLRDMIKKIKRKDMMVVSVSTDLKLAKLKEFASRNAYPFFYLHDPDAKMRKLFSETVPSTYIISKDGEWIATVEGYMDWDKKEIRNFVEYLANK
jgi:ankyrin repeat protein/peroxiredoxin